MTRVDICVEYPSGLTEPAIKQQFQEQYEEQVESITVDAIKSGDNVQLQLALDYPSGLTESTIEETWRTEFAWAEALSVTAVQG